MTRAAAYALVLFAVAAGCAPVVRQMGPAMAPPLLAAGRFVAADGVVLPVRVWRPAQAPTAVVVALHGFNDYSKAFETVGARFAAAGILTYAYDQRGFGGAPDRGRWAAADAMAADLRAVTVLVRRAHPGVPLFLLGESMGAAVILVAVAAADPPRADGLVLAAPAVRGWRTMGVVPRAALWLSAHTIPWFPVHGGGLGIRPSDNIEMLIALRDDPLVIKNTRIDAVYGLVGLMDAAIDAIREVRHPTLILLGEKDEVIPRAAFDTLLERADAKARVVAYPVGYHMLLRDRQAARVLDDIVAWIGGREAPPPRGGAGK